MAAAVRAALAEDLDERGDVTTAACVPATARLRASVVVRQPGVLAGTDAIAATYAQLDQAVTVTTHLDDGTRVDTDAVVATVDGPARSVLTGERTALNLLSHLSGIATATAAFADELAGTGCVVRDTRKTLPGLRALAKAAVVAGGGVNHRTSLSDGVLIKDNHVAAAGGVAPATTAAMAAVGAGAVQVEVDDLAELDAALAAGATSVLLDNFAPNDLPLAVARCRAAGDVFVEVSGGVDLATAWAIGQSGVDAIAVGSLTHSVRALDIGLDTGPVGTEVV